MLREFLTRLRFFMSRKRPVDLDEELQFHLDQSTQTNIVRATLLVLMGAVGFMLLIACTNVSNLLLAKAEDRKKEIATRTALGASRWRIIRQVLIENLLLFLAGGSAGLLLAFFGLKILPLGDTLNVAQFGAVALNLRVLAFATIVCLFTGLLFGLMPALKASHIDFNDTLKTSGRNSMGSRHRTRTRSLLVISEIAFSLVLLTGAGLMTGSLKRLLGVTLGFDPKNVVTMRLSLPEARYPLSRTAAFYKQLQEQVRSLPGVEAVAIVNHTLVFDCFWHEPSGFTVLRQIPVGCSSLLMYLPCHEFTPTTLNGT